MGSEFYGTSGVDLTKALPMKKIFSLIPILFGLSVAACGSKPPPPAAQPETTSADVPSREAFTPPDQWEMKIADKQPEATTKDDAPATRAQADTTVSKRQSGLINLPGKAPAAPAPAK
jgi:hypothetical protein